MPVGIDSSTLFIPRLVLQFAIDNYRTGLKVSSRCPTRELSSESVALCAGILSTKQSPTESLGLLKNMALVLLKRPKDCHLLW